MKKLLLSTLVLFLFASAASAQGFKLGVRFGANMNKVTGQPFKDQYDLGYHLGAFSEIDVTKKFGIQPEVIFNQVNTKRTSGFDQIYNENNLNLSDIKLTYLSIPVLLRYSPTPFLTINLGPQFGKLINHNENIFENGKKAFKDGDLSAVAGLSVNVSKFRIYGRYNVGLSNINDIDNRDKWRSQQAQLGLGITL